MSSENSSNDIKYIYKLTYNERNVQNSWDRQADEKSEDYIPINIWRKSSSTSKNYLCRQAKEIVFLPTYPGRINDLEI
jgi:hypothetical protein